MPGSDRHNSLPRVAAVLVVHDGVEWLGSVLAALAAQRYPALDLVVVDNASTDGSAEVLQRHIPADNLLTLPTNIGFGAAVWKALEHPAAAATDLLLLLHDDLALAPDAIGALVAVLEADDRVGVVGPKLREWSDDGVLAEVGMTIDRFGRAVSRVDPAELDQGQHDATRDVLYVNTAGMLLRGALLRELGGFDSRFPVYRDDLDLCWRARLAGHRVEVVPAAIGYHIAAGTRAGRRFGSEREAGRRYLVERHALASLFKNYGALRLARTLPIVLLLAVAKTVAFLLIRRFAEAGAVVRAYAWNLLQLPATLRRRHAVQHRRAVGDGEVVKLFAPGLPRARLYLRSLGAWLAGGSTRALADDRPVVAQRRPPDSALLRTVAGRSAVLMGTALGLAYLIGLLPLLGGGQVVGGEVAPWPGAMDFLRAYLRPFNGDPAGTYGVASPVQALLGVASFAGLGSQWLAQRLLVFGLLPLAWLLMLRAGRLITPRAAPRTLGATLYVLSPVVLASLGEGRYGVLLAATVLPGIAMAGWRAADPLAPADSGWRAMALLALGLTVAVGAAPSLGPLVGLLLLAGMAIVVARRGPGAWTAAGRLLLAAAAAAAILAPWLYNLAVHRSLAAVPADRSADLPMWRAAVVVPAGLPDLGGVAGVLAVLTSLAVAAGAVVLGWRHRPATVAVLATLGTLSVAAAWLAARLHLEWLWTPGLLLPAALALAGLGVLAADSLGGGLREYSFGLRQVVVVVAAVAVTAGLLAGIARLAGGPYDGLARAPQLVPAFVTAEQEQVGPYRVLVLAAGEGEVTWDVMGPAGPTMLSFGTVSSRALLEDLGVAVAAVTGGDPQADVALSLAGVRYVAVSRSSRALTNTLAAQPGLEALPTGDGRVYAVRSWLPRAVGLAGADAQRALTSDDLRDVQPLDSASGDLYSGGPIRAGLLLLSEPASDLWQAEVAGRAMPRTDVPMVNAWNATAGSTATIRVGGATAHRLAVGGQLLVVAVIISLLLRPPGATQRQQVGHPGRTLPRELAGTARQSGISR